MKVIYNKCYGGYGLSIKAQKELAKQLHQNANIEVTEDNYGYKYVKVNGEHFNDNLPRHSKLLISMFEEHGSEWMSDTFSELALAEISGNKYLIEEYDGSERVVEPKDIEWIEV